MLLFLLFLSVFIFLMLSCISWENKLREHKSFESKCKVAKLLQANYLFFFFQKFVSKQSFLVVHKTFVREKNSWGNAKLSKANYSYAFTCKSFSAKFLMQLNAKLEVFLPSPFNCHFCVCFFSWGNTTFVSEV